MQYFWKESDLSVSDKKAIFFAAPDPKIGENNCRSHQGNVFVYSPLLNLLKDTAQQLRDVFRISKFFGLVSTG